MLHPSFELNCVSVQTQLLEVLCHLKLPQSSVNLTTTLKATILQRVFLIGMYNETTDSF